MFGGDSWGREAQHRKRRVDQLAVEGLDASSYKKLSTGKFACLLCPNTPVLHSPLMLSMHMKGSRHCAAETHSKNRELSRHNEIKKRIALSSVTGDTASTNNSSHVSKSASKPLIEQSKKAACESCNINQQIASYKSHDASTSCSFDSSRNRTLLATEGATEQLDFRERKERELRFTAAGWKRDCHGRWFRDENVEFDSDEEDPNVSLA